MNKCIFLILCVSSQYALAQADNSTTDISGASSSNTVGLTPPHKPASNTTWEAGAGLAMINLPLYPGSKDDKNYAIPFPYIRIQTQYFEIDEGVRGFLYESPFIRFNISGDLGIPASSKDSDIRTDMPNLKTVIQLGPSMEMIFAGGRKQPYEFRFEIPVRTAIASDLKHTENLGWIIEPRLSYETLRPFKTGFSYQISGGLRYASQEYHAYYYDVDSQYVTAERPEFHATSGYSGAFLDIVGNWRADDFIYFGFVRYQNFDNTEYELSPLREENDYLSFGIGMLWIFAGTR